MPSWALEFVGVVARSIILMNTPRRGVAHKIQCCSMSYHNSDEAPPFIKHIIHGDLLHNQDLENVSVAKYSRVAITGDLDLGHRINEITNKSTTKTIGFLCRNLHFAAKETKTTAYCMHNLLVRSKIRV